ncbi:MAG: hypothetical protein F6K42_08930 [Leptolyngbya sp. SIO1D8]|nr:hypothetical protein [Leptolyngbya sp. SIO1D8]
MSHVNLDEAGRSLPYKASGRYLNLEAILLTDLQFAVLLTHVYLLIRSNPLLYATSTTKISRFPAVHQCQTQPWI